VCGSTNQGGEKDLVVQNGTTKGGLHCGPKDSECGTVSALIEHLNAA